MNEQRTKPILRWQGGKNDSEYIRDLFKGCRLKPVVTRNQAVNRRTHGKATFGELMITPK